MGIKVFKREIHCLGYSVLALTYLPDPEKKINKALSVFTHGYTSHKADLLQWATRMAESGVGSIIFDLPGHYLGSFNEVEDFESFKKNAHEIFSYALDLLKNDFIKEMPTQCEFVHSNDFKLILGGHSLGGMLSVKALDLPEFQNLEIYNISVGLGLNSTDGNHIFQSPLFKNSMDVRAQYVSPCLNPEDLLGWSKSAKEELKPTNKKIHLICGKNDVVVPGDGAKRLYEMLLSLGNEVSIVTPENLPHHLPDIAAFYIRKYLSSEGVI